MRRQAEQLVRLLTQFLVSPECAHVQRRGLAQQAVRHEPILDGAARLARAQRRRGEHGEGARGEARRLRGGHGRGNRRRPLRPRLRPRLLLRIRLLRLLLRFNIKLNLR